MKDKFIEKSKFRKKPGMVKVGTYDRYCHEEPEVSGDAYQPDHPAVFVCERTNHLGGEDTTRGPFWEESGAVYQPAY